jgi:hypothetical protein
MDLELLIDAYRKERDARQLQTSLRALYAESGNGTSLSDTLRPAFRHRPEAAPAGGAR